MNWSLKKTRKYEIAKMYFVNKNINLSLTWFCNKKNIKFKLKYSKKINQYFKKYLLNANFSWK